MSKSSLSSVVSNLVRAQMGTSVSSTVTDDDLDRHVAELILKEAKQKAEKYGKEGIRAYLPQNGGDSNAPKTNKRFLSSIIRSTDDHNKTILRAQALAAQEVREERLAQEKEERRKRAEEAVGAERMRRLMGRGGTEWSSNWDGPKRDKKRRERSWERKDDNGHRSRKGKERETDDDRERSRRRRHHSDSEERDREYRDRHRRDRDREEKERSRSRLDDETSGRKERRRERRGDRHHSRHERRRSPSGSRSDTLEDPNVNDGHQRHRKGEHDEREPIEKEEPRRSRHRSRRERDSRSPVDSSRARRKEDDSTRTKERKSHRGSQERLFVPDSSNRSTRVSPGLSADSSTLRDVQEAGPSRAASPSPGLPPEPPKRRPRSPHSSGPHEPSASPPPLPPNRLPSKMDRYFEESYDPRFDVAPLSLPSIPSTGLISDAEFAGWDAMLEIIRQRREDKEDRKRLERLGIGKDKEKKKSKIVEGSNDVVDIMSIEYKKRGSVREWDLGKDGL